MGIPESEWKWCGMAGHLNVGHLCRYHLLTHVGKFRISTVGAYYPDPKGEMETIGGGDDAFFETLVFRTSGLADEGCSACHTVESWGEIDGIRYPDWNAANDGHMGFCRKYAKEE